MHLVEEGVFGSLEFEEEAILGVSSLLEYCDFGSNEVAFKSKSKV